MKLSRLFRGARTSFDRVVRVALSAALLSAYVNINVAAIAPTPAAAAPAALSVTSVVTNRPLLGGKATVRVTVKNTDSTDKAYNVSLANVFSSSRTPTGTVTFVSASDGNGGLPATSVDASSGTGLTTVNFANVRDLAPQETWTVDIVVDLSSDSRWLAGDSLLDAITASANTIPNQTIPDIVASASTSAKVLPIIIRSKTVQQSTGVEQATGTGAARQFTYTLDIQNNYTGPSQSVVVTDTLPDGIEYLGMHASSTPAPAVSRDASTGVTTLVWTLGTEAMGANPKLVYDVGIRYDYYGTNNGGVNRPDSASITPTSAGTPILTSSSIKKTFVNHATLGASWLSNPASDTAQASVTGAALTVAKAADKTSGGLGTVINYTLTYATSQYYSAVATRGLTLVHDHVPDGQIFDATSSVPAPSAVTYNTDGSTDVTWTVGPVANTSGGTIKFTAVVGTNWQQPNYAGDPIVSGDSMANTADISGVASDNVNPARPNFDTSSTASVGFSTHLPGIQKQMLDPNTHLWSNNVTMTVGDTSTVRVRFNTTNGTSAERSDINMGNIALTDWLPAGMSIVPGTYSVHYSSAGDFTLPTTGTPPPLNLSAPTTATIGGVQGVSWYLGNVASNGWWEATFDVRVNNVPAVKDGTIVANLWKLTGVNTFGVPYSARDLAMCAYQAPHLTLTKTGFPPNPLTGGAKVPYALVVSNVASATAYRGSITDTLPVGERATTPTVDNVWLGASPLTLGSGYTTTWDSSTGELGIDLQSSPISAGTTLAVAYTATTDNNVTAGASLTNTATIAYSSRSDLNGRVTSGTTDPADDNTDVSTVQIAGLAISKNASSGPFTVGQTIGYDLDVTVPAHTMVYWPTVNDLMTRTGFVPTGTPSITQLSTATPLVPASFAATSSAPATSTPSTGKLNLRFDLSDPIDNTTSNVPYKFRIHFDGVYTSVNATGGWDMQPPLTHDTYTDTAGVAWNTVASAIRSTNSVAGSNLVTTNLQQPLLKLTKSITSTSALVGGSPIDYQIAISNVGSSTAFDPSITDTLPVGATDATITSISCPGSNINTAAITSFVATPTMRIGLAAGSAITTTQTLTIKYRVMLPGTLGSGAAIVNNADVNWNSLSGGPAGSRIFNDGPLENWTQDAQSKSTNAQSATIVKRGPAGPFRIGDVLTYSIDATVPANTIAWTPQFTDTLSQRGLVYVSNSATITARANPPSVEATLGAASTPTSTTTAPSNTILTWSLPSAIDNSANNRDYGFTLTFQVLVTGNNLGTWEYWPATASQLVTDTAAFKWYDKATSGTQRTATSNNATSSITQPLIRTTKSILTTGSVAGGSAIDYQVTLANAGYNTAYDVSVTDTMPAEMSSATLASATQSGVGDILGLTSGDFSHLPTSTVTFDPSVSLPPGGTITLVYHCALSNTVGAGATLTNQADANWSSMPGAVAGERVYNDSPSEGSTWTADTTSVATTTPLPLFAKRLPSGFTTATIGTSFPYTIEATIPANTTAFGMTISDLVPPSLSVVALASPGLPAPVVGAPTSAGTPVTVGPVDWPAAPSSAPTTVAVTLLCQVRDTKYGGGSVVNGSIANTASLAWNTRVSGGSALSTLAGPVNFTVVQPILTVTKSASATSAGPADTVTFTSVLANTGDSAAYLPSWRDVLPSSMTNPTLLSVRHSSLGTLTAGSDYSSASNGATLTVAFDQPSSPSIAPGESVTIRFTGTVVGGVRNGASMTDTATVVSYSSLPTGTPPARGYNPVSASATVTALSPGLVITKSVLGDAYPVRGSHVTYRVRVRNVGSAPAVGVITTDALPADLTYVAGSTSALWPSAGASSTADPSAAGSTLAWDFGGAGATLAPGDTLTIVFDAAIDASATIGQRVNTAHTSGNDASGSPIAANTNAWISADTSPTDSASATIRVVQPGVAVAKARVTADGYVQVGQPVGFRLTVTNTGDTTLTTAPLADTFDANYLGYVSASTTPSTNTTGSLTWSNIGPIGPNASKSVNVTFTVTAQPPSRVETNVAIVTGATDEFSHPLPSTQDTANVTVTRPAVAITKTLHAGQDTTVQVGGAVTYDLTVTNTGDTRLDSVPLSDAFDGTYLTFASASISPAATSTNSLSWSNVGPLAVGAHTTLTVTFSAKAVPADNITTDTATVAGASDENSDSPSPVNSSAHVAITRPSVHVVKTLVGDPVIQAGQLATFRLTVTNTGDTTLQTIPLADSWDGLALAPDSAAPAALLGSNAATWTLSGPLAPGASTVATLTLRALAVPSGQVTTDTAVVGPATDVWGDSAAGDSATATVRITSPSVAITKALHTGQDPVVQVGQNVTYDLTVTNTGDTTLLNVPVTDSYDSSALTYVSASVGASSAVGGVVSWPHLGPLAPGAVATISVVFHADHVPAGQVSTDTAAVTNATDSYGDHPADASAGSSIRITRPDVRIVKQLYAGQDTHIQPGESATFDLGVTNTGDTTLATATVSDTWDPAVFTFGSAAPAQVSTGTGAASWTLSSLAPGTTTTITVTLSAIGSLDSLTTTDTADVSAVDVYRDAAGPSTSDASIQVTHPAIAVRKTLSAGQDPVVQVGQSVSFDLRVTNSGNTTLQSVPLSDTYDATQLAFTTATVAPDSTGAGSLSWNDLGSLAPQATKVVTVTFSALAVPAGQVSTDTVASRGSKDVFGDTAPDAQDDASVRITRPAVSVNKKLRPGQDTAVQQGQSVKFDLVVTNTGDTRLDTVPLDDVYDAARLQYVSATATATTSGGGAVHWDNVGPLDPNASTTVTVSFSAISNPPGQVTTDTALVRGATDEYGDAAADSTSSAGIKITAPSYTLTKTRLTDSAIQTSQTVTFALTVKNTGDTTLTSVPLEDAWDAGYLAYFSADQAPVASAPGFARWLLLPIPPGQSETVSVTFVALSPVPGLSTTDHAAVVGATDENGDPAVDQQAQDSVDVTNPAVAITKTLAAGQDTHPQVGDEVDYTLTVSNAGDTPLVTVPATDTFDSAHLTYLGATPAQDAHSASTVHWDNVAPLAVGASTTLTVRFTAKAIGSAITNSAETSGTDSNGDPAPSADASDSVLRITRPGLALAKVLHAGQDPQIQAGQTATYDLVLTNSGDTTLTTADVNDAWDSAVFDYASSSIAPSGMASGSASWVTTSPLAPGASTTITVTLRALAAPADLHSPDTARASATDEFGDAPTPVHADADILVTRPAVAVRKRLHAGQDDVVQVGEHVKYDFAITNTGDTTLTDVPLHDAYDPAALAPFSASPSANDLVNDGTLDWSHVATLAPGETTTVTATFTALAVPSGQVTTDVATASGATDLYGDTAPSATDSASVRITHPALAIAKAPVVGQDPAIQVGQTATFTITVTNTGDTRLVHIPMTDVYDPSVLSVSSTALSADTTAGGTISWSDVGALDPGASTTVTVAYTAIHAAPGQVTSDTAGVTAATDVYGDHPATVSANASVKVTRPALTLTKTLAPGQDLFIQQGQTVTFHLAVTNSGDTTLTGVPLADTWDTAYLQFASATQMPDSQAAGMAHWTLHDIAPGTTAEVDLTLLATGQVPGHVTTDTALVNGATDENGDGANDDASQAAISITKPMLAITKKLHAGQDTHIQPGQNATFDIVVTNVGDITVRHIQLRDDWTDYWVIDRVSATPAPTRDLLGYMEWDDIGPLDPGQSTTVTVTMHAWDSAYPNAAVDTATVTAATDVNGDPVPSVSATAGIFITVPYLEVSKHLAPKQPSIVRVGSTVDYDLTVQNTGDTTVTSVPATDTFDPADFAFVSADLLPSVTQSGMVAWANLLTAPLGPGASATVRVRLLTLRAGTPMTNTLRLGMASDEFGDRPWGSTEGAADVAVYDPASLVVTKTADPVAGTVLLPSQVITYTISWANTGDVPMADVFMNDPVPDSVNVVPGTVRLNGTLVPNGVLPGHRDVHVGLGLIGAHTSGTITFQAQVAPENVSAKGVLNSAYFVSQESTIATAGPIYNPVDPITITKVGRDINGGALKGGDVIEWTITVTNIGLSPTTHVVVRDAVPFTTVYVKHSIKGRGANDAAQPKLVWDIGTMAVGETQVVTFRSTVKKGLPTGTKITNQAVVSSDQSRPKKSDNPQTTTAGDPTILVAQTSGSEGWRFPLGAGLLFAVAGLWLWPRRRKLVPALADDRRIRNPKGGDRNA